VIQRYISAVYIARGLYRACVGDRNLTAKSPKLPPFRRRHIAYAAGPEIVHPPLPLSSTPRLGRLGQQQPRAAFFLCRHQVSAAASSGKILHHSLFHNRIQGQSQTGQRRAGVSRSYGVPAMVSTAFKYATWERRLTELYSPTVSSSDLDILCVCRHATRGISVINLVCCSYTLFSSAYHLF
jgi:hypothetical protein